MSNAFYTYQINKAIDYIKANLKSRISLASVSNVTCFSQYHFHRIFKSITKENLNEFIKREKMEYALRALLHDTGALVKNIAYDLGYNSTANFSRDFKQYYGISPNKVVEENYRPFPRKHQSGLSYKLAFVDIINLPELTIYYKRITGYEHTKITNSFEQVVSIVKDRKLEQEVYSYVGIAHDDPEITKNESCIYDAGVCLKNADEVKSIEGLNCAVIEQGKYAKFDFRGKLNEISVAWDETYEKWLCICDYIPENKPNLEMILTTGEQAGNNYNIQLFLVIKNTKDAN